MSGRDEPEPDKKKKKRFLGERWGKIITTALTLGWFVRSCRGDVIILIKLTPLRFPTLLK